MNDNYYLIPVGNNQNTICFQQFLIQVHKLLDVKLGNEVSPWFFLETITGIRDLYFSRINYCYSNWSDRGDNIVRYFEKRGIFMFTYGDQYYFGLLLIKQYFTQE